MNFSIVPNIINQRTEYKLSLRKRKLNDHIINIKFNKTKGITSNENKLVENDYYYEEFKTLINEDYYSKFDNLFDIINTKDQNTNYAIKFLFELSDEIELDSDLHEEGWSDGLIQELIYILADNDSKSSKIYNYIISILVNVSFGSKHISTGISEESNLLILNKFCKDCLANQEIDNKYKPTILMQMNNLIGNLIQNDYENLINHYDIYYILNQSLFIFLETSDDEINSVIHLIQNLFNSNFELFTKEKVVNLDNYLQWICMNINIEQSNSNKERINTLLSLLQLLIKHWTQLFLDDHFINNVIIENTLQLINFFNDNNEKNLISVENLQNTSFLSNLILILINLNYKEKQCTLFKNNDFLLMNKIDSLLIRLSNFTVFNITITNLIENIIILYNSLLSLSSNLIKSEKLLCIFDFTQRVIVNGVKNDNVIQEFIYLIDNCFSNGVENQILKIININIIIDYISQNKSNFNSVVSNALSITYSIIKYLSYSNTNQELLIDICSKLRNNEILEWMKANKINSSDETENIIAEIIKIVKEYLDK